MKDYKIISKDEVVSLVTAERIVKAIDFDNEIVHEVGHLQINELSKLYRKSNVLFVVKGKYELGRR